MQQMDAAEILFIIIIIIMVSFQAADGGKDHVSAAAVKEVGNRNIQLASSFLILSFTIRYFH